MSEIIQIDDLAIEVRRSDRRRTVDLTVDRLGDVVIAVPTSLGQQEIEEIIRRKQMWIYTTLVAKEEALTTHPPKEYVSGEGFYYLGRKYRLKLIDPEPTVLRTPDLALQNGRFLMRRDAAAEGSNHFAQWYSKRGRLWLTGAVKSLKGRVAVEPKSIAVRDLGFRWASCSSKGDLYFHWRVMLLPADAIRYLVLHELVHLREHNHSPAFYEILARIAPDHQEWERWLKLNGSRYAL